VGTHCRLTSAAIGERAVVVYAALDIGLILMAGLAQLPAVTTGTHEQIDFFRRALGLIQVSGVARAGSNPIVAG